MTRIPFTKMQAVGNDFVIIDGVRHPCALTPERLRFLGDRHFGVGADQILWIGPSLVPEADFAYRIFNQDGSEAEMCGNGARAIGVYVRRFGLSKASTLRFATRKGIISVFFDTNDLPAVNIGIPDFSFESVGFDPSTCVLTPASEITSSPRLPMFQMPGPENPWCFSVVSMGNPHAVIVLPSREALTSEPAKFGPLLERFEGFKAGTNVEFLLPTHAHEADVVVWERGAGFTLACGTGACAVCAVGMRLGLFNDYVTLNFPGGSVDVIWDLSGDMILKGPAQIVFEGMCYMPDGI